MKITTNYNKQDWELLFAYILFGIVLIYIPLGLWYSFVVVPAIDELEMFNEYLTEQKIIDNYAYWLVGNGYFAEGETSSWKVLSTALFLGLTLHGADFLIIIIVMWVVLIYFSKKLIHQLAIKLKLKPKMRLIIFKNGKPWIFKN